MSFLILLLLLRVGVRGTLSTFSPSSLALRELALLPLRVGVRLSAGTSSIFFVPLLDRVGVLGRDLSGEGSADALPLRPLRVGVRGRASF